MYICEQCGKIYEDDEIESLIDGGEGDPEVALCKPIYSTMFIEREDTCSCGGDIMKAKTCEKCGCYMPSNTHRLCAMCRDEYKTADTMLKIGFDNREIRKINGFLASVFDDSDIDAILLDCFNHMNKEEQEKYVNAYCEEDIDYYWGETDELWKEEN